jgi:Flp pilus assembly pilin Flp
MNLLKNFLREQEGQDGVEYALLIGFVSATIVAGASTFTTAFSNFWGSAGKGLDAAGTAVSAPVH